jgi:hypothetical protein
MKRSNPVKARRPVGFIEPCIPTVAAKVPEGPIWVHEIKHDGYRLQVRRDGAGVDVGFHSRASFCASAIWAGVMRLATISRFLTASLNPLVAAAKLSHICAVT